MGMYKEFVHNIMGVEASIEGYTCGTEEENWRNYLIWHSKQPISFVEEAISFMQKNAFSKVGVITSLYVDDEERNQGYGSELLEEMMGEMFGDGVDVIILESDIGSSNDFNLTEWYKNNYNFRQFAFQRKGYPLLYLFKEEYEKEQVA